jgi:hypothetical protein
MAATTGSSTSGAGQAGRGGFDLSLSCSIAFRDRSTTPAMSLASAEASST